MRALMTLISMDQANLELRIVAVACLNDNVKHFYKERTGEVISQNDKAFLRQNIIAAITAHLEVSQIRYPRTY